MSDDWMPGPETAPGRTPEEPEPAAPPSFEPAVPTPLGVVRTPTGNAEVDARLERLADADHLTADGHTPGGPGRAEGTGGAQGLSGRSTTVI